MDKRGKSISVYRKIKLLYLNIVEKLSYFKPQTTDKEAETMKQEENINEQIISIRKENIDEQICKQRSSACPLWCEPHIIIEWSSDSPYLTCKRVDRSCNKNKRMEPDIILGEIVGRD